MLAHCDATARRRVSRADHDGAHHSDTPHGGDDPIDQAHSPEFDRRFVDSAEPGSTTSGEDDRAEAA